MTYYIDITSPCVDIFFHSFHLEYWVQTENRTPPKPLLGGVRVDALSINSPDQTQ